MSAQEKLEGRLRAVESRLAQLDGAGEPSASSRSAQSNPDEDVFYALNGLKARAQGSGAVVYAGFVGGAEGIEGGGVDWQYGVSYDDVVDREWAERSSRLEALASPVRLTILQSVHEGIDTVLKLTEVAALGSSGQIYHHVNLLLAARWLVQSRRGHYAIPPERVIPLLVILTASEG